jgi:hypothetical protein
MNLHLLFFSVVNFTSLHNKKSQKDTCVANAVSFLDVRTNVGENVR